MFKDEHINLTTHPERHWYALYTRSNFERLVRAQLAEKGLTAFLPLHTVVRFWSDRKKRIDVPLFPSYVFVHADRRERYRAVQCRGVVRMVSFTGEPARIPAQQIESIRRILQHGYEPVPHQYLRFGDEVEIVAGALQGLRGFYVEDRGHGRLVVSVDAIQQSVAVEVERDQVRRLRKAEEIAASLSDRPRFKWV